MYETHINAMKKFHSIFGFQLVKSFFMSGCFTLYTKVCDKFPSRFGRHVITCNFSGNGKVDFTIFKQVLQFGTCHK
jgi:hypothetical protein